MQEGLFRRPIRKTYPEFGSDRLEYALRGEEVFPRAVHAETQRFALFGHLGKGQLLGDVYVCKFEQARAGIAAADVAHERGQHGRRERRAHDAHVFADRVFDAYRPFRLPADAQLRVIFGRDEGIGDDLVIILPARDALDALFRALRIGKAAARDLGGRQEGAADMVIAVHADDFLRKVGIPFDVFAVRGGGHGDVVALCRYVEVEPL